MKSLKMEEKEFYLRENESFIELNNLLKIMMLVQSGGEAKLRINDGEALLNGEVETRKRKKIMDGDKVEFDGVIIHVKNYQA